MEIAIGIQEAPREVRFDSDGTPEEVRELIDKAIEKGAKLLWLSDTHGKQIAVPLDQLAYIELDPQRSERRVGFGASAG